MQLWELAGSECEVHLELRPAKEEAEGLPSIVPKDRVSNRDVRYAVASRSLGGSPTPLRLSHPAVAEDFEKGAGPVALFDSPETVPYARPGRRISYEGGSRVDCHKLRPLLCPCPLVTCRIVYPNFSGS